MKLLSFCVLLLLSATACDQFEKRPSTNPLGPGVSPQKLKDLGLEVTKAHRTLGKIVYLGRVAELRGIAKTATHLELGAAVTWSEAFAPIVAIWPVV